MEHAGTRPLIIAHRGDSRHAPENTLAAFRTAMEKGADGVEFDVRLAGDGVPVVIHDATLKRTAGVKARVEDLTSAELAKVDVGSWFNAHQARHHDPRYTEEHVPSLISALELLAGFDGPIYIELKCGRRFMPLVEAVCDVLGASHLQPRIIVKSFRLSALSAVRERLSDVQIAALFGPSIKNVVRRRSNVIDIARERGATQLSLHRTLATPRLVSLAHRAKMPVTVWTIDDPKWIGRCARLGIRALITNDPAKMLRAEEAALVASEHHPHHIR